MLCWSVFARRTQWNLKPNELTLAIQAAKASGRELIDLTASNPTECGFAYEGERIRAALSNAKALHYEPEPFGILSARQAVADYYAQRGLATVPERILLTTSTSEAYSYIFRLLCDPGDEVLVPRPSYPLFDLLADVQDVALKPYNLFYDHGWHLDVHSVERLITERTRAIMVVSPNNPTGSYLEGREADELEALGAKHNLAIVADEVFGDYELRSDREAFSSWAGRNKALTFTLCGLSKAAGLPQIKLAWTVVNGPEPLRSEALKRIEIIADTYLSVNAPVQHALPELLATAPALQEQIRTRCRANRGELERQVSESRACSLHRADAGWYAILRIPNVISDDEFAIRLIQQHGVLVHPGHFYNFTKDGYAVVSLLPVAEHFRDGVSHLLTTADALLL
jgi:alanine-synthesizing transaminase